MLDLKQHNYRFLVLGTPGSEKSTLARKLAILLSIEAIHLDMHYWQENWVETSPDEWGKKLIS